MKHFKSVLAMLLVLVMVLSCVGTAFAANKADSKALSQKTEITDFAKNTKEADKESLKGFKSTSFKELNSYQYADDEIVRAIVLLEGDPTADVAEANSEKAASQKKKLMTEHQTVLKAMAGIDYELKYEFVHLLNGFSCDVAYGDLEAIAAIDGVTAVHIANSYAAPELEAVEETKQAVANQMTGNMNLIEAGANGAGIVVAVLDTGLTTDHEAFQDTMQYTELYGVLTEEAVTAAETWTEGKYLSSKVPFAYDYANLDDDVTDYNGHGTHVSGTAVGMAAEKIDDGGYSVTFCGASPAAQLLAMKIFADEEGGTSSDIYFFALDDAYILGADVINMSIGAQNGFTYDSELETEVFGNIYERLADDGVILSVAAGNEYSMANYACVYEGYTGCVGPEYADYGTVASPSTYEGNVSVASVENYAYPAYVVTVGETALAYTDSATTAEDSWLENFGGETLEYVMVVDSKGNFSFGYEADYANVDVSGKVAVVSRGDITFEEKVEFAAKAGAIGCMVVNNADGIISMAIETFEIPAISLQKAAYTVLAAAETKQIVVSEDLEYVENANGYLMSDFSNWGTSPMLTIDPTITSVGGQVYSSVPGAVDAYEVYSGTSMAAPNATGTYANLLSLIYAENPEISKADAAELAKDLLYSSALLLTDAEDYIYSVRKQGAGLGNGYYAADNYMSSGYINNAIQELGDDAEKAGAYNFSVEVVNDSANDLYYTDFYAYVMYDYLYEDKDGVLINTLTSEYCYLENDAVSAEYEIGGLCDVTYSIDGTEVTEFNLAAGSSVTVDVTITLSAELKEYFDSVFPNGNFVEGYVGFCDYREETYYTDIHSTFMAFYGDWTDGDVLEEADFRDIVEADLWLNTTVADEEGNTYADYGYTWDNSGLIDFYTSPNIAYLVDSGITTAYAYAGDNMLDYTDYYDEHIAFSTPLTDGTYNYAEAIYMEPYQLRNASHLIMTVSDKETGDVYYVDDTEYLPKAYYDEDYGMWFATGSFAWDGTDMEGNYVPSGTVATITYDAVLPYGDAEQNAVWSFDVTVDYTAPVLEEIVYDAETDTLTVTASDENYLQAIYLADESYTILDAATFSSDVKGESFTATFDVSGIAACYVTALDYATNEMEEWTVVFEGEGKAKLNFVTPYGTETVTVELGSTYTFGKAKEPENYEFMFWAPEKVEQASEDEVWYVPEPWWFEDDSMIVTESEYTFYALYAVLEYTELDKTNYYMDYDSNYDGDWAICGWNLDSDYYFVVEDPMALDANGKTVRVADISDAEMGTEYIEFYTNEESIRYTFEKVGEDTYTIKSVATGKYLATNESYEIVFVDEPTAAAQWFVFDAGTGYSTAVFNAGVDDAVLVYDDEAQEFAVYDDSKPYYGEYYPSEWFYTVLYRCADESATVLYYTTECAELSDNCFFNNFTDCNAEWYHEAVDYVAGTGLMGGVSATEFAPQGTMTRAMIVTVLYREAGSPAVAEASSFSDVPAGQWYSDAVAWAEDNGVVNGVGEGKFDPMGNVTREQIATILWRYEGSPEAEADLSSFNDAASISDYAKDAMTWAVSKGILNGDNGNLKPTASATRAEFACMIMRYLGGSYTCNAE